MSTRKARGVYEKVRGSGIWWIRYMGDSGIKREKVGRKSDATALYAQRKSEVRAGKKLPPNLRHKGASIRELAEDALTYSRRHKADFRNDNSRMKPILARIRKPRSFVHHPT